MKLLLGGIGEAVDMARAWHRAGIEICYSHAGLVRSPDLPCTVISGGFARHGGLEAWLAQHAVDLVIDATHPYADTISATARRACKAQAVPLWRYQRPPWEPVPGDRWQAFADWSTLLDSARDYRHILVTAGRLDAAILNRLSAAIGPDRSTIWIRSARPLQASLPAGVQWIEAIGPFALDDERALMKEHAIDLLISKQSGGAATYAKMIAARELAIDVHLLSRPPAEPADRVFSTPRALIDAIIDRQQEGRPLVH